MPDNVSRLPARPSFEQLRKQAKDLLATVPRSGHGTACERFAAHLDRTGDPRRSTPSLADAQFVLAREFGFESWIALKRTWSNPCSHHSRSSPKTWWQCGTLTTWQRWHESTKLSAGEPDRRGLRQQISGRLGISLDDTTEPAAFSITDARLFVARVYGFGAWADLEESVTEPASRRATTVHGVSTRPPFYRIRWMDRSIEPRPPLSARDWEESSTPCGRMASPASTRAGR